MLIRLVVFLGTISSLCVAVPDCSHTAYDRCVRIADPLIKEARLVFPDNTEDIDIVCRTWNRFVDCLKAYTENCFTEQQRRQFNRAVERPIESVHEMCTMPSYQQEYLQYAPCIKSTITERNHCGPQYNLLVEQVAQGDIISKSTLCCSHDRFKQCVYAETRRLCDRGASNGPASRFSNQIIEKALSFLQDQCLNYIPNLGDCSTHPTDSFGFSDPLTISPSSSEVYPWSTLQDAAPKEILPSRVTPPRVSTAPPWLPTASNSEENRPSPSGVTSQVLGTRTRPASYGRASTWSDSSQSAGNTVPLSRDGPTTTTTIATLPSRPEIGTIDTWNVMGQPPGVVQARQPPHGSQNPDNSGFSNSGRGYQSPGSVYPHRPTFTPEHTSLRTTGADVHSNEIFNQQPVTSTQWYPAAGTSNHLDEPNQQSLTKTRNGAESDSKKELISITVIAIMASLC